MALRNENAPSGIDIQLATGDKEFWLPIDEIGRITVDEGITLTGLKMLRDQGVAWEMMPHEVAAVRLQISPSEQAA